jgi:hypothetical protein
MSEDNDQKSPPPSKASRRVETWLATPVKLHAGRKKGDREKAAQNAAVPPPAPPAPPVFGRPKTPAETRKEMIAARPKPYGLGFKLQARNLCDADWKWKVLVTPPDAKHGPKATDTRPLSHIFYYEFARESRVLRLWATIAAVDEFGEVPVKSGGPTGTESAPPNLHDDLTDKHREHQAITERLQRGPVKGLYSFLWALGAELATDTPWKNIDPARRDAAIKGTPDLAPTIFAPWPSNLRPAHDAEVQGHGLVVFDQHKQDQHEEENDEQMMREHLARQHKHIFGLIKLKDCWAPELRKTQEVVAFWVDWEHATKAELAEALEWWRPWGKYLKEAKKDATGAPAAPEYEWRKIAPQTEDDGTGKGQAHKYRAYLRSLASLRLRHSRGDDDAHQEAIKEGIASGRKELFHRDLDLAVRIFRKSFYWIDGSKPLSAKPAPG